MPATVPFVFAYHEIVGRRSPAPAASSPRAARSTPGPLSPDFYGWVFPHGATASIGTGSAHKGFSLRRSVTALRPGDRASGAGNAAPRRRADPDEARARWDNGRDVVVAGDAAGVVAPASGEGIYYAMAGRPPCRRGHQRFSCFRRRSRTAYGSQRSSRRHERYFGFLG